MTSQLLVSTFAQNNYNYFKYRCQNSLFVRKWKKTQLFKWFNSVLSKFTWTFGNFLLIRYLQFLIKCTISSTHLTENKTHQAISCIMYLWVGSDVIFCKMFGFLSGQNFSSVELHDDIHLIYGESVFTHPCCKDKTLFSSYCHQYFKPWCHFLFRFYYGTTHTNITKKDNW